MELNDGSQYRVVTDPARHMAEREVFMFRGASARGGTEMYVDTAFSRHRADLAPMRGLVIYQFVYANLATPEAQAAFFVNDVLGGQLAPNEMVMVDPEVGGGFTVQNAAEWVRRWLAVVEPALNTRAWVYVPRALSSALQGVAGDRVIMAPRYSGTARRGTPPDWHHDVHQFTDRGYFPGCSDPFGGDTSFTTLTADEMLARSRGRNTSPMPNSYNGWSAGPGWSVAGGQLQALVVAGEPFSPGVRKGDVHTVLQYVAQQLHNRVEPVVRADFHQADDWGYSYRANTNNPSQLSCHASGTAIDYNATRHPNGKGGTWTAAQKAEIQKILAEVGNVVKCLWGYDEMHFEISGTAAQVAAQASKIRGGGGQPARPPAADPNDDFLTLGDVGPAVTALQEVLNRWYPSLPPLQVDGDFGEATRDRVIHFQKAANLTADGEVGPASRAILGLKPPSQYVAAPPAPPAPPVKPGVSGEIGYVYDRLPQAAKDKLGEVQTPELTTPDDRGRYNHFAGGSIYWTPENGAFVIWGAIREAWAASGWETGPLGYPISHEVLVSSTDREGQPVTWLQSNFEKGFVSYSASGVVRVCA